MNETWTEYGVMWDSDPTEIEKCTDYAYAARLVEMYPNWNGIVVGRQVTASDWLPVDTDGAK